ncbi:MAG: hypothetical protein WCK54_13370 [Desulfuromonadales bacterium]
MKQVLHKISELSKSCEEADFLPNILGVHCQEVKNGTIPVVLISMRYFW